MRTTSMCTFICVSVLFSGQQLVAADPVPAQGAQTIVVGFPTGASPVPGSNPPLNYSLTIYYTDPTGKNVSTNIMVSGIPAGPANPTAVQVAAASLAKQMAIIKAINAANIPIKPVTIAGTTYNTLTATADATTQPGGMYPTGKTMPQNVVNRNGVVVGVVQVPVTAPANFSTYTVNGVTQKVIDPGTAAAKLGNGVYRTAGNTVTGEVGNGKGVFSPGTAPGMGSSGSSSSGMAMATFQGLGATAGLTTGKDASGNASVIGFGFIDETSSTPVDYIAAFDPVAGMTDADVLTDLMYLFNEDFGADGYTSTYDPTTDTLSIDQLLPAADFTWSADSDTGMFLEDSLDTTPEPDTLVMVGTGLVGLAAFFRRRMKRD
jgi:PEP-CTERM motif